jgi:hypothetical protein
MSQEHEQRISDQERLKAAVNGLIEHFDTVQIFATRHESGTLDGTVAASRGGGNWYARIGHVKEWILQCDGAEFNPPKDE